MDWGQKKIYICSLIDLTQTNHKTNKMDSRRKSTFVYHIKDDNEKPVRVCKKMFLSTFDITEKQVRNWREKSTAGIPESSPGNVTRIRAAPLNEFLKDFFGLLPKMPSHYCRKSSTKLYLEPIYNSKAHLYSVYKAKCSQASKKFVSSFKFHQVFEEQNLSLFSPKKDQCDTCCSYQVGNISEEEWNMHQTKKREARSEKEQDKIDAIAGKCYALTMDLESVKCSPYLKASALYYKTKLTVHNFTVYNIANHHAT